MNAWYENHRSGFIHDSVDSVVDRLASAAAGESLHIDLEQKQEWQASVGLLRQHLDETAQMVELLRETLTEPDLADYEHVVLEYDFRRRGMRIDCVLLGKGILAIIEFKRSSLTAADRDQVADYAINLLEFHEETRRVCDSEDCVIAPILALTSGHVRNLQPEVRFHRAPWSAVLNRPLECDRDSLHTVLRSALSRRRGTVSIHAGRWLGSRFSPSSTIIDAAISLYGQHDVSSIREHAAEIEHIKQCSKEVADCISKAQAEKKSRIVFVSGSPGAGKTLVGLTLAFDPRLRNDAVFVTGNAPLVDVLSESLKRSYRRRRSALVFSGYAREQAMAVIRMSTFKIVKAHAFLGQRGERTESTDGRVVIFDEAQRTYEEGRAVLRRPLERDEALLILKSLDDTYGPGCVVVALLGHNQAINRGELGMEAWFRAAEERKWRISISEPTVEIARSSGFDPTRYSPTDSLKHGHLAHSLRFYRNHELELWADHVLGNRSDEAREITQRLSADDTLWLSRNLQEAKQWIRDQRVGDETAGMIASGQARRLAAEGLFVDFKPDIAHWILAPSSDIRSSSMLETVQNQYQIQGLEIDYALVCWDADLRREGDAWKSYRISGPSWQRDEALEIAKNGYRVLLTRARKGMIVFVPKGDLTREDPTRLPEFYEGIATYLVTCGAKPLVTQPV